MRRRRRRYPSDLTDAQWAQLAPLLPAAKPGGQPRTVDLREVVNAILYVLREGGAGGRCRTTSRPGARRTGTSGRGGATALGSGATTRPRSGSLASQRVKPAREDDAQGGPRGYDAGTQVLGRKRPSAVDTQGLLLRVVVHSAGIQDRDGGKRVVAHLAEPGAFPRLIHRWADGASGGTVAFAARYGGLTIELVPRPDGTKGFTVLPRRWVVERTFAWLGNCRWLSKDFEALPETEEAFISLAMTHLMLRRLAPGCPMTQLYVQLLSV